MTDANQFNQLKMDTLRIEIEYERLDRKVDKLQSDVTSMRDELGELRGEIQGIRGEIQGLRNEMHAGFDRLERIVLKVLDRKDRSQGEWGFESSTITTAHYPTPATRETLRFLICDGCQIELAWFTF